MWTFKAHKASNCTQIKLCAVVGIRDSLVHMGAVRLAGIAVLVAVAIVLGTHTSLVVEVIASLAVVLNSESVGKTHVVTAAVCGVRGEHAGLGAVGFARVAGGCCDYLGRVFYRVAPGQGVCVVEELAWRALHGVGGGKEVS